MAKNICIIFVFSILCLQATDLRANVLTKYLIIGNVFYDKNKNSVRDAGEYGVGGIEIIVDERDQLKTDVNGHFEVEFATENFFSSIRLNQETFPPGSTVVGSADEKINIERGKVHNIDFAIYYPTIDIEVPLKQKKLYENQLFIPGESSFELFKTSAGIISKGHKKPLVAFKNSQKLLSLDTVTMEMDGGRRFFLTLDDKTLIHKVDVLSRGEFSSQEKKILKLDLNNKHKNMPDLNFLSGQVKDEVRITYQNQPDCYLYAKLSKQSFQNNGSLKVYIDTDKDNKITLDCSGLSSKVIKVPKIRFNYEANKFTFLRNKKIELEIQKSDYVFSRDGKSRLPIDILGDFEHGDLFIHYSLNKGEIRFTKNLTFNRDKAASKINRAELPRFEVTIPKYYNDSLVNRFFFLAKPVNLTDPTVLGKDARKEESYLMDSRKSINEVPFSGKDQSGKIVNGQFDFVNFKEKRDFINLNMGYFNSSRQSSLFNVEYSIDLILFWNFQAQYFVNHFWGMRYEYSSDIYDTILTSPSGDEITGSRSQYYMGGLFNLNLTSRNYFGNEYYFTFGYRKKTKLYTSEDSSVALPNDYSGLEFGLLTYIKFWPNYNSNLQLEGSYSNSISDSSDRIIRGKSTFLVDLNVISNFFKWDNYFNYYNRHDQFEKFSFAPSLEVLYDKRGSSNFETATITSLDLSYSLGIFYYF